MSRIRKADLKDLSLTAGPAEQLHEEWLEQDPGL